MSWDAISRNFSGNWYVTKNRHDREADGAIHWGLMSQKLKFAFLKMEELLSPVRLDQSYLEGKQPDTISVLSEFF